jgi:dihydrodipicolinate synthase/N-acetylneuraminate lyase
MIHSACIRGVLAPVVIPFKADLSPDREGLSRIFLRKMEAFALFRGVIN